MDSVHCVRFNPVETSLLGAAASDRSVILYDTRETRPMRKVWNIIRFWMMGFTDWDFALQFMTSAALTS